MSRLLRYWPALPLLIWLGLVIVEPWLTLAPNRVALDGILAGPGAGFWLGQDELGRPVLDRLLGGARTALSVCLFVVGLSALLGIAIGTLAGWFGGWIERLLLRLIDLFMAFPGILLAIALAGVLGPGLGNLVIALTVVGWVGFARLARAQVLSLKQREHVQAARALGTRQWRILLHHLLPLMAAPLVVEATFGIAGVVIAEAGLSFLGLGIQPPEPSWGSMIRDGARYLLVAPHLVLAPGMAILLVVLSVNLLGDRLRDRLDVRGQRSTQ